MAVQYAIEFPESSDWMVFPWAVVEDPSIVKQWAALQARDILKTKGVGFLARQRSAGKLADQILGVADMAIDAGQRMGAVTAYLLDASDLEHVLVERTFTMVEDGRPQAEIQADLDSLERDDEGEVVTRFDESVNGVTARGAHVIVDGGHRVIAYLYHAAGCLAGTLILRDAPVTSQAAVTEVLDLLRCVELLPADEPMGSAG